MGRFLFARCCSTPLIVNKAPPGHFYCFELSSSQLSPRAPPTASSLWLFFFLLFCLIQLFYKLFIALLVFTWAHTELRHIKWEKEKERKHKLLSLSSLLTPVPSLEWGVGKATPLCPTQGTRGSTNQAKHARRPEKQPVRKGTRNNK